MSSLAPVSSPPPATNTTTPPTAAPPPPLVPSSPPPTVQVHPPPTTPPPATPTAPPPSERTPPTSPPSPPTPSSIPSSPPPSTKSPPVSPFNPPPPPSKITTSPPSSSSSITTSAIIGIAIGGVVILLVISLVFICCTRKRKKRRNDREDHQQQYYIPPPPAPGPKDGYHGVAAQHMMPKPPPPSARPPPPPNRPTTPPPPPFINSSGGSGSNYAGSEGAMEFSSSKNVFTFEELERATNGFSEANLLGQGGFGYVLKGVLPNGKEVAVKSLKDGSVQGDREFQAEVEIISRVHHRHLVSLVGYCISGSDRMLVYEFVPNKTLEFHLHGKGQPTMNWPTRLKIALGSAKGLAYLHEDCYPKIIHRDIKAANILLDFKFEAKVADFGLAKFSSDVNTHVSTRVMGTFGYLAPEYASSGKLTEKSDVFSFGVMLLELITGKRPFDTTNTYMDDCLVDWARPMLTKALENNNFDSLVDPQLQKSYNHNEMARMVACAAASVRHSARRRPRMSQVVRALEGHLSLSELNDGIRPGHSTTYGSSDYEQSQYKEDMKIFRQTAPGSQEPSSSEYSGTTGEYGINPSGLSGETQTTREMEMGRVKRDSQGFSGDGSTEYTNTTGETEIENVKKNS